MYFSRTFHDHPILMLAAYRPDIIPSWAQGAHYQRLGLKTLSSDSSIKLIRNILGKASIQPDVEKKLIEKTGGNPFFVEEMVRELVDRRFLVKKGDQYISDRAMGPLEIPATIQGVLAARMDRLSEDLKRTMQTASVIGRDFTLPLLKRVMEPGDDIRSHLATLVGLEIFCEKALFPELEYTFKHALTQEVAYESLLKQRRNDIHCSTAQALEELYAEKLEEHYELIAYHYDKSDNHPKTVEYLILAGEKSIKNGAAQTAFKYFERVLQKAESQHIELDVDTKIRAHLGSAESSFQIGAIGRCVTESRTAAGLSRQHDLIDYEKDSLFLLTMVMYMWPVKAEAEKAYREGLARAREIGDKGLEGLFLSSVGIRAAIDGKPYKGCLICRDAEKLAMKSDDRIGQFSIRLQRAQLERLIGRPEKTIELTENLAQLAPQTVGLSALSHIVSVKALAFRGLALSEVGRIEDGIETLKRGIDICEKFGIFLRFGRLLNTVGYSYGEIHQTESALAFNHRAERVSRSLMKKYPMGKHQYAEMVAQSTVNLIENLVDQRNVEKAWKILKDFETEALSQDYDWLRYQWESRMNYLAATLLLQRNDIDRAELFIRDNIKTTRENHMKKREGSFLRLLGEVQIRRNQLENAIVTLNKSIHILKEVGNPKLMWETYSTLAAACRKRGRVSEENESWGAAAEIITGVADGLSDYNLKSGFLNAKPVQQILSKEIP